MICNYSSVLFLCIIFIFSCYIAASMKLKFVLMALTTIIKCSDHEYLIIKDWFKFQSLNISCSNQAELFENQSPDIYNFSTDYARCNENTKTFWSYFYVSILSSKENETNNLTNEELKLLSTTLNFDNLTYAFEAIERQDTQKILLNNVSLKWSSNNVYRLYTTFKEQPISCRIRLNFTAMVEDEKCTDESGNVFALCYHEPLSKSPLENINWQRLIDFLNDGTLQPSDWREKGGLYIDVRLLRPLPDRTTSTTTTRTKSVTTTETALTTTTTVTSKSTSITSNTWTTSVSSPTTNLDGDGLIVPDMHTGATILSNTSTTLKKIKNITPKSSTKTSRKLKSPKNNSAVLKNPSSKKNSSSRSNVFILLLVLFMLCIIGSILFFIYRFRQNRQGDNQSLLDRVGSEESSSSDMNESETNSLTERQISTDAYPELAEIEKKQKGGRMLSQLDPDAL